MLLVILICCMWHALFGSVGLVCVAVIEGLLVIVIVMRYAVLSVGLLVIVIVM